MKYKLKKEYYSPFMHINEGVTKDLLGWKLIFPDLDSENIKYKSDWFDEIKEEIKEENDEQTNQKLIIFLKESEKRTNEAKGLTNNLTFSLEKNTNFAIQFRTNNGTPYLNMVRYNGYSFNVINLELSEVRCLLKWLKDLGIK